MPRKKSYLTVTDQFCGAGGSSQGARNAGIDVKLALNHWKLAIDTHNTNFPETDHDCTDISACDPRRYSSTDILITSPECTNHTLAKGVKIVKKQLELYQAGKIDPAAERSRATMWDVPRFAEYHNYNAIIVENVVDARVWVMFDAWLLAMHSLGYNHRCVYLNSMHAHPTPQSRDRMYVVFWKKGNRAPDLDFTPSAWCPNCAREISAIQTWKRPDMRFGKYDRQYIYCCPSCAKSVKPYYYAAFNCIDWTNLGERIGDRKKPLSANTIKRAKVGLKRYKDSPFIINDRYSSGVDYRIRSTSDRLDTITGTPGFKMVSPFIVKAEHANQSNIRSAFDAFQTQTTRQSMGLITPLLIEWRGSGTARPVTKPFGTVTAGGIHHGLITTKAWNAFLSHYNNGSHCTNHFTEAIGTVTATDRSALVSFKEPSIEDCYYRMLKPKEVKLAMAFEESYIVLGNRREQVKQLGNAVTPPAMEWLINQVKKSLS